MDSYVLSGMQYGDEGKGTFVDYLTYEKNADCIIRYNGGSQASHTVITPNFTLHKFSQLGSGMFKGTCHTYLTENMVVNLYNLMREIEIFAKNTNIPIRDIVDRIHVHQDCYMVTPYHRLINRLRELSKGDNRRGSVGTGVSEVAYLLHESNKSYNYVLGIKVRDIYRKHGEIIVIEKFRKFQEYASNLYLKNKEQIIKNIPIEMKSALEKEVSLLLQGNAYLVLGSKYIKGLKNARSEINFKRCIYFDNSIIEKERKCAIFEGSQGLLIDGTYGIFPNTTFLDTTNIFAKNIVSYKKSIKKIGIAKAFATRHGRGIFPTESNYLTAQIYDKNQESSFWNGNMRFGWLDTLLLRYAQKINDVDELFLSSLDILSKFSNIKICNEYLYKGKIDDEFKYIFKYYISDRDEIIIIDIKENRKSLSQYLSKCIPIYINVNGWEEDISNITKDSDLPKSCIEYINLIEYLVKIPITVVSVGPTRNNKIKMDNI